MEISNVTQMGIELQSLSRDLLMQKYAHDGESTPEAVLDRVAKGLAKNEKQKEEWTAIFRDALDFVILGGRINASAGLEGVGTTWVNCFVQPLADSVYESDDGVPGIMEAARQAAQTMRLGGGVGYDFSVIRPKGSWISKTKSLASGPISYMEIFNSMCSTVMSAGARRGAQMGILRCDHPDIFDFIVCKKVDDPNMPWDRRPLRNFNLSVGVTDALMQAVAQDREFELLHAAEPSPAQKAAGAYQREDGKWVYRTVRAKDLYDQIMQATYQRAEPGVVFLDSINKENNLWSCETITATNPCGEEPLPPYGCCDLGHLLLPRFVKRSAWEGVPEFDFEKMELVIPTLVRMLDNVLDLTPWPLPQQKREAMNKRRIGVGFTGLGDVLIMMGLKYSSKEGREFARRIVETLRNAAYVASVNLAIERGPFPLFHADSYLMGVCKISEGTFASRLPEEIKKIIRQFGIRNSHLLALAPTGTGSLTFGNNCSSGCEPVFSFKEKRMVLQPDGTRKLEDGIANAAYLQYIKMGGDENNLPDYFENAQMLSVSDHLEMLKTLAPYIDAAISKTINIPADYPFDDFKNVYMEGWLGGLKGLTTYRPNNEIGSVLIAEDGKKDGDLKDDGDYDQDRRLRLTHLPETVMKSLRWLDRPHMPEGNPSYTYMVESPQGDFAVMIGHYVNGDTHPFEVWVNGSESPRGLGAIAKTLSADMRTYDRGWLKMKLQALRKCEGEPFETPMPPDGCGQIVSGSVSAFARIVQYHTEKIGWMSKDGDSSLVDAMMFRKEPKAGTEGTLSWTVDVVNPATGDDFVMFVKELEMPDGSRRPYSVWLAGDYPKTFDGLCKVLSLDMRVLDPAWIAMKLRKLLSYKEPRGDFLAKVPGGKKQESYHSTIAYIASLLLYRYKKLGILNSDGVATTENAFLNPVEKGLENAIGGWKEKPMSGKKCPECSVNAVIKYNGCDKCANCGYVGSCG
jgi:ribonucleoside-diphosphate reductase alpha chain